MVEQPVGATGWGRVVAEYAEFRRLAPIAVMMPTLTTIALYGLTPFSAHRLAVDVVLGEVRNLLPRAGVSLNASRTVQLLVDYSRVRAQKRIRWQPMTDDEFLAMDDIKFEESFGVTKATAKDLLRVFRARGLPVNEKGVVVVPDKPATALKPRVRLGHVKTPFQVRVRTCVRACVRA
jgi:hypothetical protein